MCETNTLVIYKIPKPLIAQVTAQLGALNAPGLLRWTQLRFMKRVLAVFGTQSEAVAAQPLFLAELRRIAGCEEVEMGFSINNVAKPGESHLQLPDPGKLWFVSPPPSPPNEWQETPEDEPNRRIHYEAELNEQLVRALRSAQEAGADSFPSPITPVDSNAKAFRADSPRTITIIEAQENKPALQVTADEAF